MNARREAQREDVSSYNGKARRIAANIAGQHRGVTRVIIACVRPMCGIKATDSDNPQRTARRRLTAARSSR